MADHDFHQRARLAYDRFTWLSVLSGGAVVALTAFMDNLAAYGESRELLILALVGLAFTLFVSTGVQIVASAADRWAAGETASPAVLVWEWRLVVLAHLGFLISILLLVSFVINNLQVRTG